jgi:hypothetical protein
LRVRNHNISTRFTDNEMEQMKMLQEQSGLSGETFRRNAILGICIKEAPPNEFPEFIRLLRRLNANAQQIMTQLNSRGLADGLAMRKLIDDNYEFQRRVYAVFAPYTR